MSASQTAHAPPPPAARERECDAAFLRRVEVRDVLAWLRLLVDPQDAAALARALARPPIELRQVDLARVMQVARRRKRDLVLGLTGATEAARVPPEARERVERFLALQSAAMVDLEEGEPQLFLARLIERLSARGRPLRAPEEAAARDANLAHLCVLAERFLGEHPASGARELAAHLVSLSPAEEEREDTDDVASAEEDSQLAGEQLEQMVGMLREELLAGVARIGGRLGELRLDTDLDISHGVVRYLELLKLSALLQPREEQTVEEALADINARLLAAATPLQREILQTSTLDEALIECERGTRPAAHGRALLAREEHSLVPFLPRRGGGLALSASDIQTYRACPLRYKYARVLRIPIEQTVHQRFGIVVHQVLERYHAGGAQALEDLLELLDAVWRRSALGTSAPDLELLGKARAALVRYHARLTSEPAEPVWFERPFSFRVGPHHLRGRVDRVDRLGEGEGAQYELIDYKTSRPKTEQELADDVQLSLYALAAREDWQLEAARQSYYYVLDDVKVELARGEGDARSLEQFVLEVGEGILAQDFEPAPARALCARCDYRIVCPASAA